MTVIKLQDGKYEIERDENGLMVGMWRNVDFWKSGLELFAHAQVFHAALDEIDRLSAEPTPINMILHCPNCGEQHIDAPDKPIHPIIGKAWDNPPHRSHLCHYCNHIWRPADVPTNGVAKIKTKGKNDSAPPATNVPAEFDVRRILLAVVPGDGNGEEVYAKSVADVEAKLTEMGQRIEDLEGRRAADLERARNAARNAGFVEASRIAGQQIEKMRDLLLRANDAIESLDGVSVEDEKLVDDFRAWRAAHGQ